VGLWLLLGPVLAQVPQLGERTEFAGVTVHFGEANRRAMQQEVEKLYINRTLVAAKVEQMVMYFPLIEPLLAQEAIPDDFKFLALQDSTLFPNRRSAGFWAIQRTDPLGLRVTETVDERLHLLLATEAAVARLKQLYQRTGNWVTALHLYPQGVGSAPATAPVRQGGGQPVYALNEITDELVMRLLAHKLVLERAFPAYRPQRPLVLYPYTETAGKTLGHLADFFRINEADIYRLNRWLKTERVPADKAYTVFVPATLDQYTEVKRRAGANEGNPVSWQDMGFPVLRRLTEATDSREPVFYQINGKKGIQAQLYDNDITLAYKGKLKPEEFRRLNEMAPEQAVFAGEVYYLERKEKKAKVPYHVARKGQSLWDVSQQYGVQLEALQRYNEMGTAERLVAGRIVWMQDKRPKNTPVEYYKVPEVKRNEPVAGPTPRPDTAVVAGKAPMKPGQSTAGVPVDTVAVAAPQAERSLASGTQNATKTVKTPPAAVPKERPQPVKAEDDVAEGPLLIHTAENGDTYLSVARRYSVTVQQLIAWNNLTPGKPLRPGQQLLIDTSRKSASPVSPAPPSPVRPAPAAANEVYHVVQPGENLYRIGLRYKVSPVNIKKWNGIEGDEIEVGQRLVIRK